MLASLGALVQARRTGCTATIGSARLKEEIWATALLPPYELFHYYIYTVKVVLNGLPFFAIALACTRSLWLDCTYVARRCLSRVGLITWSLTIRTTLNGGSLGSCVDEERSQLCELMQTAYCFEHRHLERILRPWVSLWPRLSEGRLINYHDAQKVVAWNLPAGVISSVVRHVRCQIYGVFLMSPDTTASCW